MGSSQCCCCSCCCALQFGKFLTQRNCLFQHACVDAHKDGLSRSTSGRSRPRTKPGCCISYMPVFSPDRAPQSLETPKTSPSFEELHLPVYCCTSQRSCSMSPRGSVLSAQLKNVKTGALVLFGEDDTFTATGAQQLLDGIKGSTKMVSVMSAKRAKG